MSDAMNELLSILDLETLEDNLFRGRSPQSAGSASSAARSSARRWWRRSAPSSGRHVHSLHAYFMRPGDPDSADHLRGRPHPRRTSFTTRRVVAIQHGKAIFALVGLVPGRRGRPRPPDRDARRAAAGNAARASRDLKEQFLADAPPAIRRYWERERPIEISPCRPAPLFLRAKKLDPCSMSGSRPTASGAGRSPTSRPPCSPIVSDMTLLDTALYAHGLRSSTGPAGRQPRPCHVVPPALPISTTGCFIRRTAPVLRRARA